MDNCLFDCAVCTDVGVRGDLNEDNYCINGLTLPSDKLSSRHSEKSSDMPEVVAAVFDGAGGLGVGELASAACAKLMAKNGRKLLHGNELAVIEYVKSANSRLCALSSEKHAHATSTMTLLTAGGNRARIHNLGDGSAFLYHSGKLKRLTRAREPVSSGQNSRYGRSGLSACIGGDPDVSRLEAVESCEAELVPGDCLLLCSDGLNSLSEERLSALFEKGGNAETLSRDLVTAAVQQGSRDNITALVVKVRESWEFSKARKRAGQGGEASGKSIPKSKPGNKGLGSLRGEMEGTGLYMLLALVLGALISVISR
ncbi:MAG: SpoIIE family protein phosphatase [Oscillospiraceae bacterium]|nr:SpoIIE family protein phosphatase [Oscillospiraceae bacterium]